MNKISSVKTYKLLLHRIWSDKLLLGIGLLSIVSLVLCHYVTIDSCKNCVCSIIDTCYDIKYWVEPLSFSYLAALIFYIVTTLYGFARRSRYVMPDVVENARWLKDSFYDISSEFGCGDWCENPEIITVAVSSISNNGIPKGSNIELSQFHKSMLKEHTTQSFVYMTLLLSQVEYLYDEEIELLFEMKLNSTLVKIKEGVYDNKLVTNVEIREILDNIVTANMLANKLYNRIQRRIQ